MEGSLRRRGVVEVNEFHNVSGVRLVAEWRRFVTQDGDTIAVSISACVIACS